MKRSAIVAGFVLVTAALGGGTALFLQGHVLGSRSSRAAAAQAGATTKTASEERQSLSRAGWETGTEYVQSIEYHVALGQESAQQQPGQGVELKARGELHSLVCEATAERVKVRYELASAKLESPVNNPAGAAGMKATEGALGQPFAVEFDAQGRALALFVRPGLDGVALGILRELIATAQLSLPAERRARWNALENDAAGEYRADYTQLGALSVQRQKTEYARVASQQGLRAAGKTSPQIRSAVTLFRLDDWGRAAELESHSQIATPPTLDGTGPLFVAATEVRARFVSRRKLTSTPSLAELVAMSLTPDARDFARAESDSDRALVGNTTPRELLAELDKLAPDDGQGASTVQVRLSALVRQRPDEIGPLLGRLNPRNAPTILGALGSVGTPEAQKALADVTRDAGRDSSVRQAAVDSMLTLEHPTRDVPDALQAAMHSDDPSLRNNSSLMLGVMSRKMAEEEPEQAAEVNHKLTTELSSASETPERLRLLGSLGNSGATEGLPQIAQALKSADPAERAQAASSLRFIKDPQADVLLSQVLVSDPVAMVRSAALGAAGFRSFEPLAAALQSVAKDPDTQLRLQLVATLATLAGESGDALLLLDRLAQSDANKDVREQAKRALERGRVAQNQ